MACHSTAAQAIGSSYKERNMSMQGLLDALRAAAASGDVEASWMLRMIGSLH